MGHTKLEIGFFLTSSIGFHRVADSFYRVFSGAWVDVDDPIGFAKCVFFFFNGPFY